MENCQVCRPEAAGATHNVEPLVLVVINQGIFRYRAFSLGRLDSSSLVLARNWPVSSWSRNTSTSC